MWSAYRRLAHQRFPRPPGERIIWQLQRMWRTLFRTRLCATGKPAHFCTAMGEHIAVLLQGPYYCSVGSGSAIGRDIVEAHLKVTACVA